MQKHRDNMDKVWNISGLKIPEGSKKEMMLKVAGTLERIPATFINGKYEGKTLAVISGLHGGEYDGIQAAIEISKELDPLELHGRVIILHPLSLSIFESGLSSVHPKDGKNLNRIFPPQHDGTVSDKIAAYLFDEILSRADFCLDIHGGGHCSVVCPHGYITGVCEDSVYMAAAAAAMTVDIPYFLRSRDETGAYNYAGIRGVPGMIIERGGLGRLNRENVRLFKKDVRNLMRHLGIKKDVPEKNMYIPQISTERYYLNAGDHGCWYPEENTFAGAFVKKGQKLGTVRGYFGEHIRDVYANTDGVLLIAASALTVRDGGVLLLACYDKYPLYADENSIE